MFMNLHELPTGVSRFTLFISPGEPGPEQYYEEIDIDAPSRSSREDLLELAKDDLDEYEEGVRVVGISDQSQGYWVWREEGWQ